MNNTRPSKVVPRWNANDVPERQIIADALICPFELHLNPQARAAQARSSLWLKRLYGDTTFVARTIRSKMPWMAAGFYPTTDLERLCIATDYLCWAFTLDDLGDETPVGQRPQELAELFERFDEVFLGARVADESDVAVRALGDIVERLARVATPEQQEVFFDANRAYYGGMVWEANNRAGNFVPDEASFLLLRPAAGAVPPFFGLLEPLESIYLDAEVKAHADVEALSTLAGRIVCWINDVLSYEKERKLGDVHNLAILYEVHRGLEPGAAIAEAVNFHNSEVDDFTHLVATLPSFGTGQDVEMGRYVRTLESMMRTTLDWTLGSARYAGTSLPMAAASL